MSCIPKKKNLTVVRIAITKMISAVVDLWHIERWVTSMLKSIARMNMLPDIMKFYCTHLEASWKVHLTWSQNVEELEIWAEDNILYIGIATGKVRLTSPRWYNPLGRMKSFRKVLKHWLYCNGIVAHVVKWKWKMKKFWKKNDCVTKKWDIKRGTKCLANFVSAQNTGRALAQQER